MDSFTMEDGELIDQQAAEYNRYSKPLGKRQHQGSSEEETLSIQPPVHIKKHKRHKKTKSKEEKKKKRHKDRSPERGSNGVLPLVDPAHGLTNNRSRSNHRWAEDGYQRHRNRSREVTDVAYRRSYDNAANHHHHHRSKSGNDNSRFKERKSDPKHRSRSPLIKRVDDTYNKNDRYRNQSRNKNHSRSRTASEAVGRSKLPTSYQDNENQYEKQHRDTLHDQRRHNHRNDDHSIADTKSNSHHSKSKRSKQSGKSNGEHKKKKSESCRESRFEPVEMKEHSRNSVVSYAEVQELNATDEASTETSSSSEKESKKSRKKQKSSSRKKAKDHDLVEIDTDQLNNSLSDYGQEPKVSDEVAEDDVSGSEDQSISDDLSSPDVDEKQAFKTKFDSPNERSPYSYEQSSGSIKSESQSLSPSPLGYHRRYAYVDERTPSPVPEPLPYYYPAKLGCRDVASDFRIVNRVAEGTYGIVYRGEEKKNGRSVALKKLKMEKEKEGFPITSIREIQTLMECSPCKNIVGLLETICGKTIDHIYIAMEYVPHDLKSLMEQMKPLNFLPSEVKCLMQQLLTGVQYMHSHWIMHRDLKTANLLFTHGGILKIGDFGLARKFSDPVTIHTPLVVTLWYRSIELLLGEKIYSTEIDMWSVGCIMAEFITGKALFQEKTEPQMIRSILKTMGPLNETVWPGSKDLPVIQACGQSLNLKEPGTLRQMFSATQLSDHSLGFLERLLCYDPFKRIDACEALKHSYFTREPYPAKPSDFPSYPAKSELKSSDKKKKEKTGLISPKAPAGGQAYNKLLLNEDRYGFPLREGAGFSLKFSNFQV